MTEEEKIELFKNHLGEYYEILDDLRKKLVRFDLSFVMAWNSVLRAEFLNLKGMTYDEYKKEAKENRYSGRT